MRQKRFGLRILNYAVTSNHIHLLVIDSGREVIPKSIQLIAGRSAQEYNKRKNVRVNFGIEKKNTGGRRKVTGYTLQGAAINESTFKTVSDSCILITDILKERVQEGRTLLILAIV